MLRVMLLQSQLPPEMWGAACILACDIYNITPHASLKMQSPYFIRHQKHPDLTFFQPFGCSMIVHRGSDLIEHGKLAPRGERCVYLGIGNAHGRRSFVGYSPRLNRIYATVHAQFDETQFPCVYKINGYWVAITKTIWTLNHSPSITICPPPPPPMTGMPSQLRTLPICAPCWGYSVGCVRFEERAQA